MNKFLKFSLLVFLVLIIIGGFIYAKMFLIGSKSYENVIIDKVTVSNNQVIIKGKMSDSSKAFKDFSYTLVGDELYVTIQNVLVSNKYKNGEFDMKIPVNAMGVKNIHLTDGKTTKVIYTSDEL